ncbi:hypothetical protein FKO59_32530 [Burkholderia pseudomallei]|nr:hypothetical protein BOC39_01325 [Burkholderia pseudomallei]ARK92788.1 hypothetical protein BOC42_23510 [Burkholderia pseudomallei]QDH31910.1 hypothetical protein FKO42_32560 [Burkholderia pseudomallei]QDH42157.1 hypothetical protein FKO59_32530 [Burkholderia pseudomallei]TXD02214.1 hypothetical protein FTI75_23820 [Burkholderia pseudomallei]
MERREHGRNGLRRACLSPTIDAIGRARGGWRRTARAGARTVTAGDERMTGGWRTARSNRAARAGRDAASHAASR